jgi:hypothetical protein
VFFGDAGAICAPTVLTASRLFRAVVTHLAWSRRKPSSLLLGLVGLVFVGGVGCNAFEHVATIPENSLELAGSGMDGGASTGRTTDTDEVTGKGGVPR